MQKIQGNSKEHLLSQTKAAMCLILRGAPLQREIRLNCMLPLWRLLSKKMPKLNIRRFRIGIPVMKMGTVGSIILLQKGLIAEEIDLK